MQVVADTNVILSALLSGGRSYAVFMANKREKRIEFIAPEFLFYEIGRNLDEIVERTRLSPGELTEYSGS
jgi:predicted nucleic acid-binding protein